MLKREPFSREQLLKRGRCCKMECINCPWGYKKVKKVWGVYTEIECRNEDGTTLESIWETKEGALKHAIKEAKQEIVDRVWIQEMPLNVENFNFYVDEGGEFIDIENHTIIVYNVWANGLLINE